MTNIANDQICECTDELVGFLYGELTERETRKFERHMQDCTPCKSEYAAFGQLHQSIVAWRDESLGLSGTALRPLPQRRPSALAAIREFLSLSPAWLKGAAALASILFCLLAVLAVSNLVNKKNSPDVSANDSKKYTQRELDARLAENARQKAASTVAVPQPSNQIARSDSPPNRVNGPVPNDTQKLRRPLSRQERQELAADLRLSTRGDDDDLDLIGDNINQKP